MYRFDWTDEVHNSQGCDERLYELRPLPDDSLDRLSAIIGEHIEPNWPVWYPHWKFPTDEIQTSVDVRIDALLEQAEKPTWRITTSDLVRFSRLTAEPLDPVTRGR